MGIRRITTTGGTVLSGTSGASRACGDAAVCSELPARSGQAMAATRPNVALVDNPAARMRPTGAARLRRRDRTGAGVAGFVSCVDNPALVIRSVGASVIVVPTPMVVVIVAAPAPVVVVIVPTPVTAPMAVVGLGVVVMVARASTTVVIDVGLSRRRRRVWRR